MLAVIVLLVSSAVTLVLRVYSLGWQTWRAPRVML
jgi:hypothetical protein